MAIIAVTRAGLVTPRQLRRNRRWAVLACCLVAAVLPGDAITMLLETLPLYLLFELSVLIAAIGERRAQRRATADDHGVGTRSDEIGKRREEMRIAIVGAGVSGLVAAHLLVAEHEVTVFEAAGYAGGHTNTVRVDTRQRDPPRRHRLHRLQRPQLPQLRAPARPARSGLAAVDDDLQRQRRPRRLRVQRLLAQRPVRQARAPGHAVVSPHGGRPGPLQPRRPRAGPAGAGDGPSLGHVARAAALLAGRSSSG